MVSSQIMKERRVYYLDCSYSMKCNNLWDLVRNNLKTAIDRVSDETTELIVIPFAFDNQNSPNLSPIITKATVEGKNKIKSEIDRLPMNKNTKTYHYVPLEDFYNNRVGEDRVTYMFLMTDGEDEDRQKRTLKYLLPQWGKKFGNKNVFGFYVMLCNGANNTQIEQIIESQEHLWVVKTADVNINLVRLRENLIFNIRDGRKKLIIQSEQGDLTKCNIELKESACESNFYRIGDFSVEGGQIITSILENMSLANLPKETIMTLCLKPILPSQSNGFTCLVNNRITIKCMNKKERTLRMRFQ